MCSRDELSPAVSTLLAQQVQHSLLAFLGPPNNPADSACVEMRIESPRIFSPVLRRIVHTTYKPFEEDKRRPVFPTPSIWRHFGSGIHEEQRLPDTPYKCIRQRRRTINLRHNTSELGPESRVLKALNYLRDSALSLASMLRGGKRCATPRAEFLGGGNSSDSSTTANSPCAKFGPKRAESVNSQTIIRKLREVYRVQCAVETPRKKPIHLQPCSEGDQEKKRRTQAEDVSFAVAMERLAYGKLYY